MKKINETSSISDLLNTTVFGSAMADKNFKSLIKHSTIFSFWDEIVGKKFAKYTIPYSIKNSKLYVSAKSPVLIQELSLYKAKLLNKVNTYSKPLEIEIKDIVFSYKNYQDVNLVVENPIDTMPKFYDKSKLENIEADKGFENEIKNHISKISFLNGEQKETLLNKIILVHKAKKLNQQ